MMHNFECVWSLFTIKGQILTFSFPQGTSQAEKAAAENLLEKAPLGHLSGVLKVATTETVKWKHWSRHSGVARCTVAIFDVLGSDAPSEPVSFVIQSQGKSSISSPTMVPEMLAPEVTSGLQQR
jgi:hypothetical protein